jgi:hypothetical protein
VTLTEQVAWVLDAGNRRKVGQLAIKAALAVSAESASADHHDLRADLALAVLTEPEAWETRFARAVATNPALSTTPSDADLEFTVASTWNAIAGAPGPA